MQTALQQNLADFIVNCRYPRIAERQIADMKYRLLDWLGCAAAGARYPQSAIARRIFVGAGGRAEASVIGAGGRYPAATAAMVNGIIGHVAEFDDGHRKAIAHPASVTLPVALALGETLTASGAAFLRALLIGYDLCIRLGQAVNPSHYRYWHTTGTCGTFAATATAAALLALTAEQTCHALGIAATMAGGLVASFGSHAKALNVGHACQNGIYAATLAKEGFTGSPQALADYLAATSDATLPRTECLSEEGLLSDTAFYKVYASCGHTHSPLDATFHLLRQYTPDIKNIAHIRVETYRIAVSLTAALKVDSEDEAKFSLPYCLAVAILAGRVSLAEFRPAVRCDPAVLALARKVEVVEDEQATARFPGRQASVSLFMRNGQCWRHQVSDASDTVDFTLLEQKFFHLTADIDRQASESVLALINHLDNAATIAPLSAWLRRI